MPFQSQAQGRAMFSAADGNSNIGIPKAVGQDFVNASAGKPMSPLPEYDQAQQGAKAKSKTHRGKRSKGKGAKAHQADAKGFMADAQQEKKPAVALGHLFKAVRSMHAAKQASAPDTDSDGM